MNRRNRTEEKREGTMQCCDGVEWKRRTYKYMLQVKIMPPAHDLKIVVKAAVVMEGKLGC